MILLTVCSIKQYNNVLKISHSKDYFIVQTLIDNAHIKENHERSLFLEKKTASRTC